MVNMKGIKVFLHDAKAISPAIATLILIVIAAVAAAGVGILVQSSQKNAADQTADKNLDVMGTLNIKGSTTTLPVSQAAATLFMKKYPAITINVGGGGSDIGQLLAFTTATPNEDIGASSSAWSTSTKTVNGILIPVRKDIIIQEAGENAKVYESKIGTGMIVVASNIANLTVVNDTAATDLNSTTAPTIRFSDLRALYNGTSTIAAIVQRADMSGTEETFAKWIGVTDANNQLSTTTTQAPAYQGNQGVRDAIAAASVKTIGFVDIGFTGTLVNGNAKVLAASMNGTVAEAASKGVGGNYDKQSISIRTQVAKDSVSGQKDNGLARDLFYYNQGIPTGAVKTYLDWIMTPDGQKVVQGEGFFSN